MSIPGPGAYKEVDTGRYKQFQNVGVKFGNSGRNEKEGNSVPGPGAFNIPSKFKGGYSFGNSKRSDMGGDSVNPGPGAYTVGEFKVRDSLILAHVQARQGKIGTFGTGPKSSDFRGSSTIGPGQYNPKNEFWKNGYSFGKQRKNNLGEGDGVPGPASYDPKCGCRCDKRGYSIPKAGRQQKVITTPGFYKIPASVPDVPTYLLPSNDQRKIRL